MYVVRVYQKHHNDTSLDAGERKQYFKQASAEIPISFAHIYSNVHVDTFNVFP